MHETSDPTRHARERPMNASLAMLLAVTKKEIRQTVRDRRMMALLIMAPVVQLTVFGYAVNLDVDDVPTVIVDYDRSRASREHVRRLLADGTLRAAGKVDGTAEAGRLLETGEAAVALVVPPGFEDRLQRGRGATVQAILDGSDPNRSNVAGSAISTYFSQENAALVEEQLARRGSVRPRAAVVVAPRVLFNPELETAVYMVPGVAAMLLMLITTIIAAMGLSREKEVGTLEQIMVTPVSPSLLILGKIIPFAAVGILDFGIALVVGSAVFDMPLRGSMALLFLATLLYLTVTLGIGLLISTVSGSQQQAFMGGFLFLLPAALLSGIMTPVHSMPEALQLLTLINPLRHYQEILRGALLRGAGFSDLWVQMLVLGVMGTLIFTVATYRFRNVTMK
ncbi:MAG: ABC transporter permease [Myxococcota bacterium]